MLLRRGPLFPLLLSTAMWTACGITIQDPAEVTGDGDSDDPPLGDGGGPPDGDGDGDDPPLGDGGGEPAGDGDGQSMGDGDGDDPPLGDGDGISAGGMGGMGGSGSTVACGPEHYLNEVLECAPWSICSPGEYQREAATSTADRQCAPCEAGTFSLGDNSLACEPHSCPLYQNPITQGGPSTNHVCDLVFPHRINYSMSGEELPRGVTGWLGVSDGGRFVFFVYELDDVVPGDTNGLTDVFRFDFETKETIRVSLDNAGQEIHGASMLGQITPSGRFVTFSTPASDVVPDDSDTGGPGDDVFLRDIESGTTTLVSATPGGATGNDWSMPHGITPDGRFVLFSSAASDLVSGDLNGAVDVFLRDMESGSTSLVSVATNGAQGNGTSFGGDLSADGRFVSFYSHATNFFPGDVNGYPDVFVRDLQTNETILVSKNSAGDPANYNSISSFITADGSMVVFNSAATNLVAGDTNGSEDVFAHILATSTTFLVSPSFEGGIANGMTGTQGISDDGRFVLMGSEAENLVPNDTNGFSDIFLRDLTTGTTHLMTRNWLGEPANETHPMMQSIAADGSFIVFSSWATNFDYRDSREYEDVLLAPIPVSLP